MDKKYENLSMDHISINDCMSKPIFENFIDISLPDKTLDFKYVEILNYFLKNPGKNTYDIENSLKASNNSQIRSLYRHANELCDKYRLLEIVTEKVEKVKGTNTKYNKPYRLSLMGIFYIILYTFDITFDYLIVYLSKNYENNVLFIRYLYPFITKQAIESIQDSIFFSKTAEYLRNICNDIIKTRDILKNMGSVTTDGYILDQIFIWPNGSNHLSVEFYSSNLKSFLYNVLKWNWIYDAKIIPNFEDNRMNIIHPQDHLKDSCISIMRSENKAVLRQQGKKIHEFYIRDYKSFLSVETKSERELIKIQNVPFVYTCRQHLFTFLTILQTQITPHVVAFDTLSQDENLKKAREFMKAEIKMK